MNETSGEEAVAVKQRRNKMDTQDAEMRPDYLKSEVLPRDLNVPFNAFSLV